jgi:signal transduction histidine kinase
MTEAPSLPSSNRWTFLHTRVLPIVVAVYIGIALLSFVAIPILAARWMQFPFLGTMLDPTLVISGNTPSRAGSWNLRARNLEYGHQIVQLDDTAVKNIYQVEKVLSRHSVGDTLTVAVRTPDGKSTIDIPVVLQHFPSADQITYIYIPYLIGLVYLACSLWMYAVRRKDATAQSFSVLTASVAMVLGTFFDTNTSHRLAWLWVMAIPMAAASLISFTQLFPQESRLVTRRPYIRWLGYLVAFVLMALALITLYDTARPQAYVLYWRFEYIFVGLAFLFFVTWTTIRYFTSPAPVVREQARLVLLGAIVSFSLLIVWLFITIIRPSISFTPYLLLPFSLFPIFISLAILRYRWLNTDYLLSRVALYGLLVALTVFGYGLVVTGLTVIFGKTFAADSPYMIGAIAFVMALLFYPLRSRLQAGIDAIFSRGQSARREQQQTFGRELTRAMELPTIVQLLRKFVNDNLVPQQFHIFIFDPLSGQYVATPEDNSPSARPTSDLRFAANSALTQSLANRRTSLFLAETETLPKILRAEQTRLALLGAQLFVPLPGRQQLTGWLALGSRRSGDPYTNRDLQFLEGLSDQAALAIERAQVVSDLERRIHAMNVLTRVSQGINITVAFDDMLELIYAQTNQVVPTRDLRITLKDTYSDLLYHVFFVENDERLPERENHPLHLSEGLEEEVLKARLPIITEDYERECRNRSMLPSAQNIYSWAGVPLNAGAETIGVISIGSRDPSTRYTEEQVNLLQAVADQAAGAIVKARLLQEAERRTRQLTTLNEVARSLTSTLELAPLLNQILLSAVEILNCEAGSLLLVDQATGELVFEVVVGPPESANLKGQRLPPGTGLVGKTAETRQPVIVNDVRRAKEWFEKTDQATGFTTRDLLVVPMQVKEIVIGVIEVINRKDGLPFTPDDQELLAAFASQAAVAIDNARLYTQTDQSLSARVEELSVMQRIDRELNASLDVNRAMRITLEWAMRQSRADAGLVGMVEEKGLKVMTSQGYTTELDDYAEQPMPVTLPALKQTIESGLQQSLSFSEEHQNGSVLLTGTRSQVAIPIRREAIVIGVLLLESIQSESCSDEVLAFLSRLSDHAAIAIANAQLYSVVQAANLAKSEFVSFVSHELKTPMTSIRGFTDLLAKGVVGQVNETQANFLNTIRSNVERMAILVSDLADVSRIEAGRLRLDYAAVPVAEVVEEVVRSASTQIGEKSQKLVLNISPDLPPMWGDRTRVIQILTNFVSNAHKYTPTGGQVTITAELADNRWDLNGAPKVIHIAVSDTGYGISPEDQKKIFQKFFRADDQKIREVPGTGLGLNIAKTLVEMQGGCIWFESKINQGTTFNFTIPIVEAT